MSKVRPISLVDGKVAHLKCEDPLAVEYEGSVRVRRCEYRSGTNCRRRWAQGRGPSKCCDVRQDHMIDVERPREDVPAEQGCSA